MHLRKSHSIQIPRHLGYDTLSSVKKLRKETESKEAKSKEKPKT